jgi:hypothetical protein
MELTMNKKRILEAIEELPDDTTVEQAMYKLYVLDKISKALADDDKKTSHEDVKRQFLSNR